MPEKILTFTAEEIARMLESGEMRLLVVPEEPSKHKVSLPKETFLKLDLSKEWEKQATRLADLFAEELSQSRDQYMETLPKFFPQPENYRGRFDTPLIVQTPTRKLTLARMLKIAGIINYLDLKKVKDWQGDPGKFKTPKVSYVTWLHDGQRNLGFSVQNVRARLATDERGGTIFDGLALLIQNPDIFKSHFLDLPGSQCSFGGITSLHLWYDEPQLSYYFVGLARSGWGSVVAGRDIGT